MDKYYLDNLPPALLQLVGRENEDRTPEESKEHLQKIPNRDTPKKTLRPVDRENEDHAPGETKEHLQKIPKRNTPKKKL
jgi:hypothetical protein